MNFEHSQRYLVPFLIFALVVLRFLARELRPRRIPDGRIFLTAALLGALAITVWLLTFKQTGNGGILIPGAVAALAVGCGLGWLVARFSSVRVEPGYTIVLGSWATVGIWIGALLLRLLGRAAAGPPTSSNAAALNAVLVVLIASAFAFTRWSFFIRARALRGQ